MKKTTLLAAILLLGASATGIGAAAGNKLEGSDTLKDMTKEVLKTCSAAAGLDYVGGGSGTAENAFVKVVPSQEVGPMSRFLGNGACRGGKNLKTAQGLVVAHDGLAITHNGASTATCASTELAYTGTVTVLKPDGTADIGCTGCDAGTNTYTIKNPPTITTGQAGWKDILRVIYSGLHHDGTTLLNGTVNCDSNVRKSLLKSWGTLFQGGCTSAGECAGGLNHAFRRDDLSGTTDTFISLVSLPALSLTTPSFCNGFETEDKDPVRKDCAVVDCTAGGQAFCDANGGGTCVNGQSAAGVKICAGNANEDNVCNRDNKLGVVLPIFAPPEPDVDSNGTGDVPTVDTYYNMNTCPGANVLKLLPCARFTNSVNNAISFVCPDRPAGDGFNIAGSTLTPVDNLAGNVPCLCDTNTARCKSTFTKATTGLTYMDHRVFNLYVRSNNATANVLINRPPGTLAADKVDLPRQGNLRLINIYNAYFRLRSDKSKSATERCALNVSATSCTVTADCGVGLTSEGATCIAGKCTLPNSDTRMIGCLAGKVDCSIGSAGKESSTVTADTTAFTLPKLSDGSPVTLDETNILNLTYPLARKLYVNSVVGFANVADTLEKALMAKVGGCYGDLATVQAAATKSTFVPEPALGCDDFNETTCNARSCTVAAQATDCKAGSTCVVVAPATTGNCSCAADADCLGGRTCDLAVGECKYTTNTASVCPWP